MSTYQIYRLTLPSGSVVRVRKPGPIGLLIAGSVGFPLFSAALQLAAERDEEEERKPDEFFEPIHAILRAALVDALELDNIPWLDRLAVINWATAAGIDGGMAMADGEGAWSSDDFTSLVKGRLAVLVDAVCHRYGITPSRYLGVGDSSFAVDLDMAIAYRGLRQENTAGGDAEVEVEDMWGNTYKVPERSLPSYGIPDDANVVHGDALAKKLSRQGDVVALSVGGDPDGSMNVRGRKGTLH